MGYGLGKRGKLRLVTEVVCLFCKIYISSHPSPNLPPSDAFLSRGDGGICRSIG